MSIVSDKFKESPFGRGANWDLNACVGINGGPYSYYDYGNGYFDAGHLICDNLIIERASKLYLDISIYPIMFMYRQGIELMLKYFIGLENLKPTLNHNLISLWNDAKGIIEKLTEKNHPEIFIKLETIILKFNELDKNGETFRFPVDKMGERVLREYSVINIEPIYKAMMEVGDIFEFLHQLIYPE